MTETPTIGNFQIKRLLGKGGMGEVYEGFDTKLQRPVAIKTILKSRRLDPLSKARFLREARILSRLDHPHICRVFEYIEGIKEDTLILEYIEGRSLKAAIKDGIDQDLKIRIAMQAAEALEVAHERGIVHRDLKPDNIMLAADDEVKVLDFGISRYSSEGESDSGLDSEFDSRRTLDLAPVPADPGMDEGTTRPPTRESTIPLNSESPSDADGESQSKTRTGDLVGTLGYMSPEQAAGRELTTASDMFSFGLVLHELFTGRKVFDRKDGLVQIVCRTQQGDLPKITGVDPDLAQLIRRLETVSPSQRPTAAETLRRLRWIVDKPRRRLKGTAIVSGVVFLALVAISLGLLSVRLSKEVARANVESEAARQTSQFLMDLFKGASPTEALGRELTAHEILERGTMRLEHGLEEQPLIRARLLATIGDIYRRIGDPDRAELLLLEALELREEELPDAHPDIADTEFSLAKVAISRREAESAIRYLESSLSIYESLGSNWRGDAALNSAMLANLYYKRGNPRAEVMGEAALAATTDAEDWGGRTWIDTLYHIGTYLQDAGRFDHAEELLQMTRHEAEHTFSENDPDLATILDRIAHIYSQQGKFDEAEDLYTRALEIREQLFGDTHFDLAGSLNNLATHYVQLGRYDNAEQMLTRALAIAEKTAGPDSIPAATILGNLGTVDCSLAHYDEAARHLQQALDILLVEEQNHRRLSQLYGNLANAHSGAGRLDEAEANLLTAETYIHGDGSQDRADRGMLYNNLAEVYQRMGRYRESESLYAKALELFTDTFGPEHFAVGEVRRGTAVVLADLGRFSAAEESARKAAEILGNTLGPKHDLYARNQALLARVMVKTGRPDEGVVLFEEAIAVFDATFGPTSAELRPLLEGYAKALTAVGRSTDAEAARQRVSTLSK